MRAPTVMPVDHLIVVQVTCLDDRIVVVQIICLEVHNGVVQVICLDDHLIVILIICFDITIEKSSYLSILDLVSAILLREDTLKP